LTWQIPSENGKPITGYNVVFRKQDDSFEVESASCDRTASVETTCTVPLATLYSSPFFLAVGDQINLKVSAINAYGTSPLSEIGGGALIQVVPDAPKSLANVPEITLDDRIGIQWLDGALTGGTSIIDYEIWSDQGVDDFVLLSANLVEREFTAENLYSSYTYQFKVRARNSVGLSEFS
jgi:hypothetical protein